MSELIEYNGYKIEIDYDEYSDIPTEWGNFTVTEFKNRDERDEYASDNKIATAVRHNRAFWLDKYEHSGVSYSLSGEGMQCQFDTSSRCALLEFDADYIKGISKANRLEYARGDINTYNQWLNGEVYNSYVYDNDGEQLDGNGGIYGYEYALQEAQDTINRYSDTPLYMQRSKPAKNANALHK